MDYTFNELPVSGKRVETFDHRMAGVVEKATSEGWLLVKPARKSPFWINEILVRAVSGDTVRLHVDRRGLRKYQRPITQGRVASSGRAARLALWGAMITLAGLIPALF